MFRALLVLALIATSLSAAAAPNPRARFTLNDQWRFAGRDVRGAERAEYDDATWDAVALPHTWNASDAFDDTPGYRRGAGWYRKLLRLDPALRGTRLFLYFEGVNQVADVWVNGTLAGRHVGGYTAFVFDVTDFVAFDRANVVAVRVDNAHDPDIPPLNADFTFYGGIYRDVWLVATPPVHITVTDHASTGVFIQTPRVDAHGATVRVSGSVTNASAEPARIRVLNRLVSPEGSVIATAGESLVVPAGSIARFQMDLPPQHDVQLWSPDEPTLYRVRTEIHRGNDLVDVVENPLGFRWFRVDPQEGFFLNGKPLKLSGTNRHQDRAGFGNALHDSLHRRDVAIVKENGFNFLRLAHYPQDPAVLEEADRLGLLVWEEIPVVNLIGMSDAFAANAERMLVEMIRQHHNHPSIVFWGYMNEVMLTKPDPVPPGYYERIGELARRLEAKVHEEDPHRKTVMALSREEVPPKDHGIGSIPDVLGLNLYFGWYYETLETLGRFLDGFHASYSSRPLIVSEYGAGSDERVHSTTPEAFDFSSEYAQVFHLESFPQIESRAYVLGSAVWNQFDFGSEFRSDSTPTLNNKGLYFFDREPKDAAFYYRAALTRAPVLHIAREWDVRAGSRPVDRHQHVWAYTNLDEVIFFVNGRTTGPVPIVNRIARTSALLEHGINEIRVSGRRGDVWFTDGITVRFDDRAAGSARVEGGGIVAAVNAGSDYSFVDEAGVVWEADRAWEGGGWGFVGGALGRTHHRIAATPDDPLFQTAREGMDGYRFDLPDGTYEIEICFAELDPKKRAGERVFGVEVNGATIFEPLDLAASSGSLTALRRKAIVEARDGTGIAFAFSAKAGKPIVSGILIRR